MIKKVFETGKWMLFGIILVLSACQESGEMEEGLIENYVDHSVFDLQAEGRIGKFGCVEFVFPVTIVFPDETEVEVGSYEELRETIAAWKEDNPDAEERPHLGLPLEVVTDGGEMITIETRLQLRRLRHACAHKRHRDRIRERRSGDRCFKLVFPVSIAYPDGSTAEYDDRMLLKMGLREWKAANPDAEERPMLSYPVTVELQDGTTQEIGSQEELAELKASCSE